MSPEPATPALEVRGVTVGYGGVTTVLHDVSLRVPAGQIVSLLGPNGAGKSTLMRAVSGLLGIHRGAVTRGSVSLFGRDVTRASAAQRVSAGLAQALEGRQVFVDLTVEENLRIGGYRRRGSRRPGDEVFESILDRFPRLRDRLDQKAGYLSGGEQQMLAMGRALMSAPKVLLLDEPSLGLAPKVVEDIRDVIVDINRQGTSILLVEQNAMMALSVAHHGYVLETGRVAKEGSAESLRVDDEVRDVYLGLHSGRRVVTVAADPVTEA
ncbi:ABC transporter ATP-binding protein [Micromonospora sp. NPDC047465]|uniref:ABC transporter ATP-binding protein n=1 Tax=Micromonospora sp. NPDC047465 TaxID=3154813 RepID=UPI003407BDE5